MDVLKIGDEGPAVGSLQRLLNAHGQSLKIDYNFGPLTEGGLSSFQKQKGLPATGVLDIPTMNALSDTPPLFSPPSTSTTTMVDIYHDSTITDWSALKTFADICCHKTNQGHALDNKFQERWPLMLEHGFRRSTFGFWVPDLDGATQAKQQLSCIEKAGGQVKGDGPNALDYEPESPIPAHKASIEAWLKTMNDACGRKSLFYCDKDALKQLKFDASILDEAYLWLAAPDDKSVPTGSVVAPFPRVCIWQVKEQRVPGSPDTDTDVDYFQGTLKDFDAL